MSNHDTSLLLSPAKLGTLELVNRMIMAPMTRGRAGPDETASALAVEYYRQRATAGLIITEGSQVSAQGRGYMRTPGIHTAAQIAAWKQVTQAVHAEGGRIFLQLWHVGRLSHPLFLNGAQPVAPSAIQADGQTYTPQGPMPYPMPRALTTEEIPAIVADFRQAAENARLAGFDGVEIHGANGYLIDQFLRDGTNIRTDAYGGSVENRGRFLKEVVESVIEVFGASRVGVRLSPVFSHFSMSDSQPRATFSHAAKMLSRYGLAYLHGMQVGEQAFDFVEFKRLFGGTYIANGGYTFERAAAALRDGEADLVSFGTAFLANPDLVQRARQGATLNEADPATFYQGEERGYTDYPRLR